MADERAGQRTPGIPLPKGGWGGHAQGRDTDWVGLRGRGARAERPPARTGSPWAASRGPPGGLRAAGVPACVMITGAVSTPYPACCSPVTGLGPRARGPDARAGGPDLEGLGGRGRPAATRWPSPRADGLGGTGTSTLLDVEDGPGLDRPHQGRRPGFRPRALPSVPGDGSLSQVGPPRGDLRPGRRWPARGQRLRGQDTRPRQVDERVVRPGRLRVAGGRSPSLVTAGDT